jgi:hypothetical protein
MTVCIQCSMRALVNNESKAPVFDETPEEHVKRMHPDPIETLRERKALEDALERMR